MTLNHLPQTFEEWFVRNVTSLPDDEAPLWRECWDAAIASQQAERITLDATEADEALKATIDVLKAEIAKDRLFFEEQSNSLRAETDRMVRLKMNAEAQLAAKDAEIKRLKGEVNARRERKVAMENMTAELARYEAVVEAARRHRKNLPLELRDALAALEESS